LLRATVETVPAAVVDRLFASVTVTAPSPTPFTPALPSTVTTVGAVGAVVLAVAVRFTALPLLALVAVRTPAAEVAVTVVTVALGFVPVTFAALVNFPPTAVRELANAVATVVAVTPSAAAVYVRPANVTLSPWFRVPKVTLVTSAVELVPSVTTTVGAVTVCPDVVGTKFATLVLAVAEVNVTTAPPAAPDDQPERIPVKFAPPGAAPFARDANAVATVAAVV